METSTKSCLLFYKTRWNIQNALIDEYHEKFFYFISQTPYFYDLRRFTGDFFEKFFLLKFMKNILQYTIDYPNVIYRKKLGVTDSGF